jgi:hypothetical protein
LQEWKCYKSHQNTQVSMDWSQLSQVSICGFLATSPSNTQRYHTF